MTAFKPSAIIRNWSYQLAQSGLPALAWTDKGLAADHSWFFMGL